MLADTCDRLRRLCLEDPRLCLVGFSGGKDFTLLTAQAFEMAISVPMDDWHKQIANPECNNSRN